MTGRTHDIAAITALGAVIFLLPLHPVSLGTVVLGLFTNQIGGIIPDIDQPTAPFWKNLPVGHILGKVTDKFLGGHRFLTHSLLGVGLFGAGAYGLLSLLRPSLGTINIHLVWWAFIIGMLSHLVMDSFTKEGVPWLLPVPVKFGFPPMKSMRITTGKLAEHLIVFPFFVAIDLWFCFTHYQYLVDILHRYIT
jgi:inner membrane protein